MRERYNSADSCSGTDIYRLLKGMVLNVVLESTLENEHEKQAAQVCSRKLLHKPCPFGLSVSRNLFSVRGARHSLIWHTRFFSYLISAMWFHDFTCDFWFHAWFLISHMRFLISPMLLDFNRDFMIFTCDFRFHSWFHLWFLGLCWRFLKLSYFSQWFRASTGDFKWLVKFQAIADNLNVVSIDSRLSSTFTSINSGVSSLTTVLECLEFS